MGLNWIYNEKDFTEDLIGDNYGFVYLITNSVTNKKYIGKKFFYSSKTRQVKGKKKRTRVESNWKEYWGSSKEFLAYVKAEGKDNFKREILAICPNKKLQTYTELKYLFKYDVLEDPLSFNDNISGHFFRKDFL
jgi:hypothetical protein